ncbi:MAG: LLM class F420-dependent oxidoreductase [Nitriliruptorales bacterium]|nr:LLM class F420-dependent oxidoreductase [Nitriliruptorales bacterium]
MSVPLAVSAPFPGCSAAESVELVQASVAWGYEACWAAEVDGPDAFSILGAVAATTDLELGVAVVPVQTRSAFVLGMTALSLASLTGGRFTLGVGASSEVLVSRFGGMPFERPLSHLREAVEVLKPILAGERASIEGEHVRVGGYRYPVPAPVPVPLWIGALNPRSLRQTGELADGLCINQVAPQHLGRMLDEVHAGAAAADRTLPDPLPVMARLFCLVTDEIDFARQMVKHVFAPYVATSVYNRFYRWQGYEQEAAAIQEAAEAKDKSAMAAAFSDRLVDDLFLIGSADTVTARIREYVEAGVTVPVIAPLAADAAGAGATLEAVAGAW